MDHAVPEQHPATVLRSHYNHLRVLVVVAMIAVVGLTVAVVVLASNDADATRPSTATPTGEIRYGGFNPLTGRPESAPPPLRPKSTTP